MLRASCLAVTCLFALSAAHAQPAAGPLHGFTLRLHGGLDHMAGLGDLNDQIHSMNQYFGTTGSWVEDTKGQDFGTGWAPYLKVPELNNRPDMGLTLEKDLINWPHSRLVAGLEYSAGASSSSNTFEFSPGAGLQASISGKESVDVSNLLATCRYSLRDPNLPLFAHVGLGLGFGSIEATGSYIQMQVSQYDADALFGGVVTHTVLADYDGSALTARLFVGAEYDMGPMAIMLDLGYNHMNFDELDGNTTEQLRSNEGVMESWQVTGAPDTRYEFVPLISESLQRAAENARNELLGRPVDESPIDLSGDVKSIAYDLSGGYARLSLGYRF